MFASLETSLYIGFTIQIEPLLLSENNSMVKQKCPAYLHVRKAEILMDSKFRFQDFSYLHTYGYNFQTKYNFEGTFP